MIQAINYARERKTPFLGICLGFQMAVVEWSRNVLGITGSNFIPQSITIVCLL
jgi:CTP synthase